MTKIYGPLYHQDHDLYEHYIKHLENCMFDAPFDPKEHVGHSGIFMVQWFWLLVRVGKYC